MKVSIVIPTFNGEDTIAECLRGVFEQFTDFETEVLVIDSSSTDRTRDIVRGFPVRLHVIPQRDFDHGDTRNLGAAMTGGDVIVFLVQDAYPARRDWLLTMVNNFREPLVAGVFCRILARPTAGLLVRKGVEGDLCFGMERIESRIDDPARYLAMDPLERRLFINFNDVASALRRSAWERLPFPRVMFGEDLLWAKGALEAGYTVVYDPCAQVVHSHEYDPKTLRKRTKIDAWLNRAYLDRICIRRRRDVLIMTRRAVKADRRYLAEQGVGRFKRAKLSVLSAWYHFLEYAGFWQGGRTRDRLCAPQAVPTPRMKILFVVHGFPPETTAGTEVLTLSLARELQRRGHDVTVLHRSGDPSLEDLSLHEGSFEGLKVLRLVHHLRFRNIAETYAHPRVEALFRDVLRRERPDVVHFEHMIHLSATLPRVCREEDVASVVTLNDFWFRCPRVQLIRPDKKVCEGPPPLLGCAACVADMPKLVAPVRIVARPLRRPIEALAEAYQRLVRKRPRHFRKLASDLACIALRPRTMLAELSHADFVIAPSPFLRAKMVEAGFPASRLIVSDYGMETRWLDGYRAARTTAGAVRFGFVGSLVWYKGLDTLARAFQRLADPRAELHVHGDDAGMPEFRETRDQAARAVTRGGLHFHGRYDPKDLGRVLAGIDVLVVPSVWYENSPLAIHEAFQAGIPVLVSDRGGMKDLVAEGCGGLRFRPGDAADLARVMQHFLDDPGLVERIAKAAPRVKTVAENAAEMEVKYRQAAGLHLAHSPLWSSKANEFRRRHGFVETQGGDLVLLRPHGEGGGNGDGPSWVEYDLRTAERIAAMLCVTTEHLPGEQDVVQAGTVFLNGSTVLRIDPESGGPAARSGEHEAPVLIEKGRNRLVVENSVRGPGGGRYFLRIRGLSLHRTSDRLPEALP